MSRCKVCRKDFTKRSMTHKICDSTECAIAYGETLRAKRISKEAKQDRIKTKARLIELKPRSYWKAKAGEACRKFVRERDYAKKCISCPTLLVRRLGSTGGDYDAGHLRGVGRAPHLEFDHERNIFGQCKHCNRDHHGSYPEARRGAIQRIGLAAVEALEADQNPRHYSVQDFKAMIDMYKRMTKQVIKDRKKLEDSWDKVSYHLGEHHG